MLRQWLIGSRLGVVRTVALGLVGLMCFGVVQIATAGVGGAPAQDYCARLEGYHPAEIGLTVWNHTDEILKETFRHQFGAWMEDQGGYRGPPEGLEPRSESRSCLVGSLHGLGSRAEVKLIYVLPNSDLVVIEVHVDLSVGVTDRFGASCLVHGPKPLPFKCQAAWGHSKHGIHAFISISRS